MTRNLANALNLGLLQLGTAGALLCASSDLHALAFVVPSLCCLAQIVLGGRWGRDVQLLAIGVVLGTGAEWLAVRLGAISFPHAVPGWALPLWVPPTWGMLGLSVPRVLSFLRGRSVLAAAVGTLATGVLIAAAMRAGEITAMPILSGGFVGASVLVGAAFALVVLVGETVGRRQ